MTTFKLFDKDNITSEMQMVYENMDYVDKALRSLLYKKELTKVELERCIKVVKSIKEYSKAISDGTYMDLTGTKLKFYNSKIKEELKCEEIQQEKPTFTKTDLDDIANELENLFG